MFLPFPSIAKSLIRWTERLQSLLPRLWLGNQMLQAYCFVNLDVAGSAVGNKNILKVSNEVPNQKTPTPADTTFLSQCGSHRPKASEQPNQTTKTTTVWITSATAEFADNLFNSFWQRPHHHHQHHHHQNLLINVCMHLLPRSCPVDVDRVQRVQHCRQGCRVVRLQVKM